MGGNRKSWSWVSPSAFASNKRAELSSRPEMRAWVFAERGPFKARRVTSAARSGPAPASGVPSAQARRGGTRRGSGRASGGVDTGLRRRLLRLQSPAPWAPEVPGRRDARVERGLSFGDSPALGTSRGEDGTQRPPRGPWVCPLRQRGGALRVTGPARGGAGAGGAGPSLVPVEL